jgi:hypothetical protein
MAWFQLLLAALGRLGIRAMLQRGNVPAVGPLVNGSAW